MTGEHERIEKILTHRFGFAPGHARDATRRLFFDVRIQEDFLAWIKTGEVPEGYQVHGYSVKRLMNEYGMRPVNAFLTLSWIARDPQAALAQLERGYDRIRFGRLRDPAGG